jgi:acetyltransferase-like isoleucine patch superfamily enzyme
MIKRFIDWLLQKIDPVANARRLGVRIGKNCRLIDVYFGSEPYLIRIGDHFSGTRVFFVTHDGGVWVFRQEHPEIDIIRPIIIGDNVFVGTNVTILPGVTIGNNVVIGAGSVVTRSIPSNCVAAGVPAKPIRSIEEYKSQCLEKADYTKLLSRRDKRRFYTQRYSQDLGK